MLTASRAVTGPMKRPAGGSKTTTVYDLKNPPPMPSITEEQSVIQYHECKIHHSLAKQCWRVIPFKISDNDFKFPWKDCPKKAWADVISYCKKPIIPKSWKKK